MLRMKEKYGSVGVAVIDGGCLEGPRLATEYGKASGPLRRNRDVAKT